MEHNSLSICRCTGASRCGNFIWVICNHEWSAILCERSLHRCSSRIARIIQRCHVAIATEKQEIHSVGQNHIWCFDKRPICVSAVEKFDRFVDRSYPVGCKFVVASEVLGRWVRLCPHKSLLANTVAVEVIYYVVSSILVCESAWVDGTAGC
jgi:hypothetical protein